MKFKSQQHVLECEVRQTIPVIRKKLHHQIEQYTAFQQKKTSSFSTAAFDRLLRTKGTDPLTLLKFRKSMLGTDILQAKFSHKIFTTYIELLDITGKLGETPMMNYLSPDEKESLVQ